MTVVVYMLYGTRFLFNHSTSFTLPKSVCLLLETNFNALHVLGLFHTSFRKLLKPNGRFTFTAHSDIRDGFIRYN